MEFGGFVIEGSRPPSVQSNKRPTSARSNHGYHTVAYQSSVDETLFSSHHPSKTDEPVKAFKAPWEYPKPKPMGHTFAQPVIKQQTDNKKLKPKGRPLLWAPLPGTAVHNYKKRDVSKSSLTGMNQFWNSRDHFRHMKRTPTFVDESLFGKPLEGPTFEAPWGDKPKRGKAFGSKSYLLNSGSSGFEVQNGHHLDLRGVSQGRPKTASGIGRSKNKCSSQAVPIWKP